jgi:hypothetical protein
MQQLKAGRTTAREPFEGTHPVINDLLTITIRSGTGAGNGRRATFSPFLPTVGAAHHPCQGRDSLDSAQNHQPFLNAKRRY